ncbi:MAG: putative selenium-dependent hydroxylase accessory protein YqeC [Oscillospiraceae bacterium]|nr:putative selenium-dependent hydroxylase accessory protein YqeC [Oscillospiraceae bacterium]
MRTAGTPLDRLLKIRPGVIAMIGSGGKTTLAHRLAAALPGRVIFCTTTRIFPSDTLPNAADAAQLRRLLDERRAVCFGTPAEHGKLSAPPLPPEALRRLADYILVEADGSAGLPLKAHLAHEPVIPAGSDRVLAVVGASGFGVPIQSAAHRSDRFAALAGTSPEALATPAHIAAVLRQEGGFDTLIVNQVSNAARRAQAGVLAAQLPVPAFAGEVRLDHLQRLSSAC